MAGLRAGPDPQGIYGIHKVVNIYLEDIRDRIDCCEEFLVFNRDDLMRLFNNLVASWYPGRIVPRARAYPDSSGNIAIGEYIYIEERMSDDNGWTRREFWVAILRSLRRIV